MPSFSSPVVFCLSGFLNGRMSLQHCLGQAGTQIPKTLSSLDLFLGRQTFLVLGAECQLSRSSGMDEVGKAGRRACACERIGPATQTQRTHTADAYAAVAGVGIPAAATTRIQRRGHGQTGNNNRTAARLFLSCCATSVQPQQQGRRTGLVPTNGPFGLHHGQRAQKHSPPGPI